MCRPTALSAMSGWAGPVTSRPLRRQRRICSTLKTFLRDWLKELWVEQRAAAGRVPFVIPDPMKYMEHPKHFPTPETTAIWSDAAVWVPWALWQAYGNS